MVKTYPAKQKKTHTLKTWPEYFEHVWAGRKRFEARKNDRGFKVGDDVLLEEFDPKKVDFYNAAAAYTGRQIIAEITYILSPPIAKSLGMPDDVAMFSIRVKSRRNRKPGGE
jgi:hypothetical protein